MKILQISVLALSVFLTMGMLQAEEKKGEVIRVLVPSMSCVGCSSSVTEELKKVDGITDVVVILKHKVALIDASLKMDDTKIQTAVEEAGYKATKIERVDSNYLEAKEELEKKDAEKAS